MGHQDEVKDDDDNKDEDLYEDEDEDEDEDKGSRYLRRSQGLGNCIHVFSVLVRD